MMFSCLFRIMMIQFQQYDCMHMTIYVIYIWLQLICLMFSSKRPHPSFQISQESCGIFGEKKHGYMATPPSIFPRGTAPFSGQSQTFASSFSPQHASNPGLITPKITQNIQGNNLFGNGQQNLLFSNEVNIKSSSPFSSMRQNSSNYGLLGNIPEQLKPGTNSFGHKQLQQNKLQQNFIKGGLFDQQTFCQDTKSKQLLPQKIKQGQFTAQSLGLFGNCLSAPQNSNNFGANMKSMQNEQPKNPFGLNSSSKPQPMFNFNQKQEKNTQMTDSSVNFPQINQSCKQGSKFPRLFKPVLSRNVKFSSNNLVLCISAYPQYQGFTKQQVRILNLQNRCNQQAINSHKQQLIANNQSENSNNPLLFSNSSNVQNNYGSNISVASPSFGFNNQQQSLPFIQTNSNQSSFTQQQQPFTYQQNNYKHSYSHQPFPVSHFQPFYASGCNQSSQKCQTQTSNQQSIQNIQAQLLAMHDLLEQINAPLHSNWNSSFHQLMNGTQFGSNSQFQYQHKNVPILNFASKNPKYDFSAYQPFDRKRFPQDKCFEDEGFKINYHQITKKTSTPKKQSYKQRVEEKLQQHLSNLPIIGNFSIFPSLETLKNYSLQQLKSVAHFKIWNKYGSIQFRQPISVIKLNLQKHVTIEQDCIVVNDVNLEAKRFWMTFHNFANYVNETPNGKRKLRKMIVSWIEIRRLKEIRHDIDTGDLVVEPPVNSL